MSKDPETKKLLTVYRELDVAPVGQHGQLQVMRMSVGQGSWISLRGRAEGRSEGGGPHLGHGERREGGSRLVGALGPRGLGLGCI